MALAYLTTVFVPLLPLLLLAVAVLASDEEVAKHCRFSLEGQDFDLCPIMKAGKDSNGWTVEWENQTPPTITKTQYRISFTGPLPRDESKPEHVQVIHTTNRSCACHWVTWSFCRSIVPGGNMDLLVR